MIGMSRISGRRISDNAPNHEHLHQSIHDILSTMIGTRLCRREYGSLIPHLIDQPCNEATQLRLMSAAVTAIIRWEPRIKIKQILLFKDPALSGQWRLNTQGSVFNSKNIGTSLNDSLFNESFDLGATT